MLSITMTYEEKSSFDHTLAVGSIEPSVCVDLGGFCSATKGVCVGGGGGGGAAGSVVVRL